MHGREHCYPLKCAGEDDEVLCLRLEKASLTRILSHQTNWPRPSALAPEHRRPDYLRGQGTGHQSYFRPLPSDQERLWTDVNADRAKNGSGRRTCEPACSPFAPWVLSLESEFPYTRLSPHTRFGVAVWQYGLRSIC